MSASTPPQQTLETPRTHGPTREDRLRIARLDGDRAHRAVVEAVAPERAGPGVAAVLRVVDADAGLTAAAARVRLARADPERRAPACRSGRARSTRRCCARTRWRRTPTPARVRGRCSSARRRRSRSRSRAALPVVAAVRVDRDVGDAAAEVRRPGVVDAAVPELDVKSLRIVGPSGFQSLLPPARAP